MNFLTFRDRLFRQGCFNINQILLWDKDFDRNNLTRWCKKGLLIKLRNGHYAFPEYKNVPNFAQHIASRIYTPSYISLQSALSFYGIIPEEVVQITSVSTLKTASFSNPFGTFYYRNIDESLFFGYEIRTAVNGMGMYMATPEKALLDLLYLNPYYRTERDMEDLRLDYDFLSSELNTARLGEYESRLGNLALDKRMNCLKKVYEI